MLSFLSFSGTLIDMLLSFMIDYDDYLWIGEPYNSIAGDILSELKEQNF